LFKDSIRCDPSVTEEIYCAIELASFNRTGDNTFKMLNVTADNVAEFIAEPFLEFNPLGNINSTKDFDVNPSDDTLLVTGVNRLKNDEKVQVSSAGSLPGGLVSGKTYYVKNLKSAGPGSVLFKLSLRKNGSVVDITSSGSGTHKVKLEETASPPGPSIGKYGNININAPTVSTDSRTSEIDDSDRPFLVDPLSDQLIITQLVVGKPGLKNGNKVRISSSDELPDGLSDGCVYYIVNSDNAGFTVQLALSIGGHPVDINDIGSGTHRITRSADFNSTDGLKSSGAEDILSLDIDVAQIISDLIPPPIPKFKDSGSLGPINWNYSLANLNVGPAIQLKTDFEMTWDMVVTDITFTTPGTMNPAPVVIDLQVVTKFSDVLPKRTAQLTNKGPNALPVILLQDTAPVDACIQYVLKPRLKAVVSSPILGRIKYSVLEAGAGIDRVGDFKIGPLVKGEHSFKLGEFKIYDGNPSPIESGAARSDFKEDADRERYSLSLVDTAVDQVPEDGCADIIIYRSGTILSIRIFDVEGNMVADKLASELLSPAMLAELEDELDPWPLASLTDDDEEKILEKATQIAGLRPGCIVVPLQAAGPPKFLWQPNQVANNSSWTYGGKLGENGTSPTPTTTNWLELISISPLSYPGEFGNTVPGNPLFGTSADVTIDTAPFPALFKPIGIESINVTSGIQLYIVPGGTSPGLTGSLTVYGGVVENNGSINITGNSPGDPALTPFLRLNSADTVLCGNGTVNLAGEAFLAGSSEFEPVSFSNYNKIKGHGIAMGLYKNYPSSRINNFGDVSGSGPSGQFLIMNADRIVNEGKFESVQQGGLSIRGDYLNNKPGSIIQALESSSESLFSFDEVDHLGYAIAGLGGTIYISPRNLERTSWNAGQSFSESVGEFYASAAGSLLDFNRTDLTGGKVFASRTGVVNTYDSTFTGSIINVGNFNPQEVEADSGTFRLNGMGNIFTKACITNFGTIQVNGAADFVDNMLFANNGTLMVPEGGLVDIREITDRTMDPNASDVAKRFPGTSNATEETLIGGTWDIAGTLNIEGATFTGLGANAAQAFTSYGSVDDRKELDLNIEEGVDRLLSLGNPAHAILRGSNWSFPAIDTLRENGGIFEILQGADFPSGGATQTTAGDFVNQGEIRVDSSSILKVGGAFIQNHPKAKTEILAQGEIASFTSNYQILGGTVQVSPDADFMNRVGDTLTAGASGTTIRVESPLIDTKKVDIFGNPVFEQEVVSVDFGVGVEILNVAAGVDISIHGSAVRFPITRIQNNKGRITVSGDGLDNKGLLDLGQFTGDEFLNEGEVHLLGVATEVYSFGYTQAMSNSLTRVGAGATLIAQDLVITDGLFVFEIASRPSENLFGKMKGSEPDFGDRLIINFTGDVVDSPPDIGDTWEIIPRTQSGAIFGASNETVTYQLEGSPLPLDWLPANSHLEVQQFETDFGPRGFGVRVVPDGGFISYQNWALANGFNSSSPNSNPMQDVNGDGLVNILEYLFGPVGDDGLFPGQMQQRLTSEDGMAYYEVKYIRPVGVDASYFPYYSASLKNWYPAGMNVVDVVPSVLGPGLEQVTLQTFFPLPDQPIFFRVQGDLNTDPFDYGLLPSKTLNHGSGLNNLDETIRDSLGKVVDYSVVPGIVLFFNVTGKTDDSIYGGTAEDGVTRNFIYQDRSSLAVAAVHSGLLENQERGIIKVTFIEPQKTPYIGSRQNEGTNSQAESEGATPSEQEAYSYFVERVFERSLSL
jgi:hypothetical protein